MSEERADARTVSRYRKLADNVDKNLKEVKELSMIGFVHGYRKVKKEASKISRRLLSKNAASVVKDAFKKSLKVISAVKDDSSELQRARPVGEVLGRILAAVRYGITSEKFPSKGELSNEIIAYAQQISDKLKKIEKQADPRYIAKRFELITKENAGNLRNTQKDLLANLAAIFEKKAKAKPKPKAAKKK